MTLEETINTYTSNAEYERTHGNLQGCLDFKQLAEWLKELKRLKEQQPILDKIKADIEQLPTKTRTNWDGCCPDIDYPEIEYTDVTKAQLLGIIDKYRSESEDTDS